MSLNSASPTPWMFMVHRVRICGSQLPVCEPNFLVRDSHLLACLIAKASRIQKSIPCQRQETKSEHSQPKLYLREGLLSLLTMGRIHGEKIIVYLGCLVNVPLKASEQTTRIIHPAADFNATAEQILKAKRQNHAFSTQEKNVFPVSVSTAVKSNPLGPAGGEPWERGPGRAARALSGCSQRCLLSVLWRLFFCPQPSSSAWLGFSSEPEPQEAAGRLPLCSPPEATLGSCQWERGVTVMGTVSATSRPPLSSSAPAKPWQLWKPSAFLWLPHWSPRCVPLPSHGASARNVFLIFIVHSVCYRCVPCNYCNSLHMCCYDMGCLSSYARLIFFFFLKPKYITSTYVSVSLPCFFILFQRSVWAAKTEWRVHRNEARLPSSLDTQHLRSV